MYSLLGGVPDPHYLSVGAGWCVQWLDRCLWSRQPVALMELDASQEGGEDEQVVGGSEPTGIKPIRGHFWNFDYSQILWPLEIYHHVNRSLTHDIFGTDLLWNVSAVFSVLPFLCKVSAHSSGCDSQDLLHNLLNAVYPDLSSHFQQACLFSNLFFFWMGLKDALNAGFEKLK